MIYQMSTPEYDEYLLEISSAGQEDVPVPFKSRSKITINASNQGQYSSGQITFDLSQLANSVPGPGRKTYGGGYRWLIVITRKELRCCE
jgi:hypothetical protein